MAVKKEDPNYLEEKFIQGFEQMLREQGAGALETFLLESYDTSVCALFVKLLRSYRRAARVANTALRFTESMEKESENADLHQALIEDMASALSDYAPAYFDQPLMERVHIASRLEQLYNEVIEESDIDKIKQTVYVKAATAAQEAT